MKRVLTQQEVMKAATRVAADIVLLHRSGQVALYGVPRGGVPAVYLVSRCMPASRIVEDPGQADVIIDDIIDSGATQQRYCNQYPTALFMALFDKAATSGDWVVFPWEGDTTGSAEDIPRRLLQFIGEDIDREGLKETPRRFLSAWQEYTTGYKKDPATILKVFKDGAEHCSDEIILVSNLQVWSKCEHHLSDVFGLAHIGYIPTGKIVGLSKFQRLIDVFARRLQVQERMTNQIANTIQEVLEPLAIGVVLECRHLCLESRGVSARGAITVTSALRGAFRQKPEARAEFMSLVRGASRGVQV